MLDRLSDLAGFQLGGGGEEVHARTEGAGAARRRTARARSRQIPQSDLVITSYALIRRDAERYREFEFDTRGARRSPAHQEPPDAECAGRQSRARRPPPRADRHAAGELRARSLVASSISSCPATSARRRISANATNCPSRANKNATRSRGSARRLRPFLLRRLKTEVAKDLPAKIEQVSFCELTPRPARAFTSRSSKPAARRCLDAVGAQGLAKSRMVVLDRAAAAAADLLRPAFAQAGQRRVRRRVPANWTMFGELLEEVIDGGHRVLVFSQFVTMLTLLKEKLTAEDIEYLLPRRLDHQSRRGRGEIPGNAAIPVFLISLKAGGVGLNLTGADTVIHFDPWWNPAVEEQATDRAHRIGQTRVVTSYKLITRGTVEEKILTLQNRKRDIIKATLGGDQEIENSVTRSGSSNLWIKFQSSLRGNVCGKEF